MWLSSCIFMNFLKLQKIRMKMKINTFVVCKAHTNRGIVRNRKYHFRSTNDNIS